MSEVTWETEHSVEIAASLSFAWMYMSDVTNWDDPPAQFRLDGPFSDGSKGSTRMPGQSPRYWQLLDIRPMEGYTVEFLLNRATVLFEWQFSRLPNGRTRLRQHIVLKGENATEYLAEMQQAFTLNLAKGMRKIANAIDEASAAR